MTRVSTSHRTLQLYLDDGDVSICIEMVQINCVKFLAIMLEDHARRL